jgi:hypothetical protein
VLQQSKICSKLLRSCCQAKNDQLKKIPEQTTTMNRKEPCEVRNNLELNFQGKHRGLFAQIQNHVI